MKRLVLSAFVVALLSTITLFAAPKTDNAHDVYFKVYNIADLPVWRTNLKQTDFAPEILIKYLQTSMDPKSWSSGGEIKADTQHASIIVGQTQVNHEAIAQALRSFRSADPLEAEEVCFRKY